MGKVPGGVQVAAARIPIFSLRAHLKSTQFHIYNLKLKKNKWRRKGKMLEERILKPSYQGVC